MAALMLQLPTEATFEEKTNTCTDRHRPGHVPLNTTNYSRRYGFTHQITVNTDGDEGAGKSQMGRSHWDTYRSKL